MTSQQLLQDLLWKAAKLRAEIVIVRESGLLAKSAAKEIAYSEYGVQSAGEEIVGALAAQQIADHMSGETLHVETPAS